MGQHQVKLCPRTPSGEGMHKEWQRQKKVFGIHIHEANGIHETVHATETIT